MNLPIRLSAIAIGAALAAGCGGSTEAPAPAVTSGLSRAANATDPEQAMVSGLKLPNDLALPDATGVFRTFSSQGVIDTSNPFFQSLGTNGRNCGSCHAATDGFSITPAHLQLRFLLSGGTDPVFRPVDGAVNPNADVSTVEARRKAYAMLLSKGVIRVGIGIPADADFELVAVDDPYHFASAEQLSLFRRPLPSTNLQFISTVMWDGRETFPDQTIHYDLGSQANDATLGHAQGATGLTDAQRESIVDFESSLYTAQSYDDHAGQLDAAGASGGPMALYQQPFYLGINDSLGGDPTGKAFDPAIFDLYGSWTSLPTASGEQAKVDAAREAIARGEALFNGRHFQITGVGGLNDRLGQPAIDGTCGTCHDTPNAGGHSFFGFLDIGISSGARRTPDLPLYTLRSKVTGQTVQTTDPGRALITGRFDDIGKFKGPTLRGLAARAPYFHNGSAATLADVVDFYNQRFGIGFTDQEKHDLAAFLQSL